MKEVYKVGGMTCASCQIHVQKNLEKLNGVTGVSVNLLTGSVNLERDPVRCSMESVIKSVTNAGYTIRLETKSAVQHNAATSGQENNELLSQKRVLLLSVLFFLPLWWIAMGPMLSLPQPPVLSGKSGIMLNALVQFLLFLPVLFFYRGFFSRGLRAFFHGAANMDTLVALGAGTGTACSIFILFRIALFLGEGNIVQAHQCLKSLTFEGPCMILILVSFGKWLEARAKRKTGDAIENLMKLSPEKAFVIRNSEETMIEVKNIVPGDLIVLRTGNAVPADGILEEGTLVIDQSALTGESIPVSKRRGERLDTGTTVMDGFGRLRADRTGADTTLAKIARMVEEASSSRAPIARIADKVSGIFVPVVLCCAVLTFTGWMIWGPSVLDAVSAAMAVLLISCPCALGLATPAAIMAGMGKGAEMGILFRNAETLETLCRINTILLDKTGTVTENHPIITDLVPVSGISQKELLMMAASLEAASQHPLARAVLERAEIEGIHPCSVEKFQVVPGEGVCANTGNRHICAGNSVMAQRFFQRQEDISRIAQWEKQGKTVICFAEDGHVIGYAAFSDPVTTEAIEAVRDLHRMRLETILLTGDNPGAAAHAGKILEIRDIRGGLYPDDKEKAVKTLQTRGKITAMVGDGINDAPALARADVGIAIGRGTDIALASADVVLTNSSLRTVPAAIALSRAVIRNIRINLFWAFFYNTLCIPVAAGILYPWFGIRLRPEWGATAMSLSSLCVVLNALRLRKFQFDRSPNQYKHKEKRTMIRIMNVEGMMCMHCAGRVEQALKAIPGITGVTVNLEAKNVTVKAEKDIPDQELQEAVRAVGYQPGTIIAEPESVRRS